MITSVKSGKELVVTLANRMGVLADISGLLAGNGINIEGVAGYAVGSEAKIMLVTIDATAAVNVLKKSGYNSIKENSVLVVELENKPGALKNITSKLVSQGVDIKQIYGTTCSSACPAKLILSTSDYEKAMAALK